MRCRPSGRALHARVRRNRPVDPLAHSKPHLGAVVGAGLAVLGLVAACSALAWPSSSPLSPEAGGALVGDSAWAWAFLGCAAAALGAYAGGLALLRRGVTRAGAVVALAVGIQLAPLGAPLLLSSDAWTYWAWGRIDNPYREAPAAHPDDPAVRWSGEAWREKTTVYGPAFTLASEPVALAAGDSPDRAAWLFKGLAAAAMVGATLLAYRLAGPFAAAFVGWNPVLALHLAGGGHNDAWLAALVLAALALRRRELAGAAWALAVLVKWVPLALVPLRALATRRFGVLGFAVAAGGVLAVATWRYGTAWAGVLDPLARSAERGHRFAIPNRLEQAGMPESLALGLVVGAFALAYLWLLREAWRGRARLGLASGLVLLASPYLVPWYLAWTVPLAAVEEDPSARWLALGLSAYLLPQTIPI